MNQTVLLDVTEGTATISLNRPAQLNALSVQMMEDLLAVLRALRMRDDFDVVLLTGVGEHFMAGGDLKDFARYFDQDTAARQLSFRTMIEQLINPIVDMLQGLQQPVVARVQGACAGFGLSLVLGSDLAVCADNARFTTAYSAIGLSADGGMSYFLPRIVGSRKALALLLLAERFDAAEALQLGIVNKVVPADALEHDTSALLERLRAGPRRAYGEIKRLVAEAHSTTLAAQLQSEADAFGRCGGSADFVEGVSAFLEKRKPMFRGG